MSVIHRSEWAMKRRAVLLASVFVIATLAVYWAKVHDRPSASPAASTKSADAAKVEANENRGPTQLATRVTPELPRAGQRPSQSREVPSLGAQFVAAKNLRQFYDQLAEMPDQTGQAKYFMAKALIACNLFTDNTPEQLESSYRKLSLPSPKLEQRMEALREMAQRCSGFYRFQGPRLHDLLMQSASAGQPAAIAYTLSTLDASGKAPEAAATAIRLLENPDAEVLERLLPYFQLRKTPWIVGDPTESPRAEILADAWRLNACSRGADCGPSSPYLLGVCWSHGTCGAPSLDAYYQNFKYSPNDYLQVVQASRVISDAISQRQWAVIGLHPRQR